MKTHPRYNLSVQQYVTFYRQGFLAVRDLVPLEDVEELRLHTEDLMQGRLPEQVRQMAARDVSGDSAVTVQGLEAPPANLSPAEKAQHFLRIHMLHRKLELHERYLLHPRVLDVLEALIGPDVLALQTMLFLKPPGKPGQGWHQDSYYIPTHPDSLCGAWICIEPCDEWNGAMWMSMGSQHEPVYPPAEGHAYGNRKLGDISSVSGVSDSDDEKNDLSRIANRYPQVLVCAQPGDVVFFGGHVLHRSKTNVTKDRFRRAFVSHYCNARSFTQWGAQKTPADDPHRAPFVDSVTGMTNASHILARGDSHLPFAQPLFGTPCAATLSPEERSGQSPYASRKIADMDSDGMESEPADPNVEHDHAADADRTQKALATTT